MGTPTPRIWAAATTISIFLLGFGALNIFTFLGIGQPHLPGLYTFRAATIGDGLLLPLLAYSLARSAGLHRRIGGYGTALSAGGAIAGMSTGAAVQVYALLDPDARLDWTFPAPHSYNLPGWYHTGFLIAASGFYGWAFALVLARMRTETRHNPEITFRRIRSIGTMGVFFPGLAFIGLLEEDDLASTPSVGAIALATMIGLAVILGAALYWACGGRGLRLCAAAVLGSLLPAIALCTLFLPGLALTPSSAWCACAAAAAAAAIFLGIALRARPGERIPAFTLCCLGACAALCTAGPMYFLSSGKPVTLPRLAAGCLAGLLLAACELSVLQPLRRE